VSSRLAPNSQAPKLLETHSARDAEKGTDQRPGMLHYETIELPDLMQHFEISSGVVHATETRQHENAQFNPARSAEFWGRRLDRSPQPAGNLGDT